MKNPRQALSRFNEKSFLWKRPTQCSKNLPFQWSILSFKKINTLTLCLLFLLFCTFTTQSLIPFFSNYMQIPAPTKNQTCKLGLTLTHSPWHHLPLNTRKASDHREFVEIVDENVIQSLAYYTKMLLIFYGQCRREREREFLTTT